MLSLAQMLSDARTDMPTSLGTAELRKLGADILRHAIFSARMSNAAAVQALRESIRRILSSVDGKSTDNLAEARLKMKYIGQSLGYDPATGFPGEDAEPAEAGDLRDLFSTKRLNLIFKTQEMMTQGAAQNVWGNEPDALEQYPAWELVRGLAVEVPRGEKRTKHGIVDVPEDAWDGPDGRWRAACVEAGDDEALEIFEATGRMVARKDSGVWQALGDGAGGHGDGLGNNYEPFAFNSGMVRVEVSAKEFEQLGGDPDGAKPSGTEFGPDKVAVRKDRLDPDILQTFIKGMESGDIKYRVKVQVVA
jgi:hypothetical protein